MITPARDIHDAAWNAVAVASLAHRQALDAADREQATFAHVLAAAASHGMTMTDLCTASGLDQSYIDRMLTETGH